MATKLGYAGIIALAGAIPDMGAISSVNLLQNKIGIDQAKALASLLKEHSNLKSLCGNRGDETELDMSGKSMDAGDAIMLAAEIGGNGGISSVNLLKNHIPMEQAKALASILKEHPTLKSLCGNSGEETELDMSGKDLGAVDVIMLAPEIAGNRAMSSANLLQMTAYTLSIEDDRIHIDQAKALASILKEHPTLKSLCGNTGNETELDMSGKQMGAKDAIMLVPEIIDNGAMMSLNLASNYLGISGAKIVAEAIKVIKCVVAVVYVNLATD
jgi:hypothetical protein